MMITESIQKGYHPALYFRNQRIGDSVEMSRSRHIIDFNDLRSGGMFDSIMVIIQSEADLSAFSEFYNPKNTA